MYCEDSICIFSTYGVNGETVFGDDLNKISISIFIQCCSSEKFKFVKEKNIWIEHKKPRYFFGSKFKSNLAVDDVNRLFCPKMRANLRIAIM